MTTMTAAMVLQIDDTDPIELADFPADQTEEIIRHILEGEPKHFHLPAGRIMWAQVRPGPHPLINHVATPIAIHYRMIEPSECLAGTVIITSGDNGRPASLSLVQVAATALELAAL